MKEQREFEKQARAMNYYVVGRFENKHGEVFVVYQVGGVDSIFFVTGDELNWEVGYRFDPKTSQMYKNFSVTNEEAEKINSVIEGYNQPRAKKS